MSNDDARLTRTLKFSLPDALMLYGTLQYAIAEAHCEQKPLAKARLKMLADQIKQLIPAEANMFDPMDFSELGVVLKTARRIRICVQPFRWDRGATWWHTGQIEVSVHDADGKLQRVLSDASSGKVNKDDHDKVRALARVIEELAPAGVEIILGRKGEEFEIDAPEPAFAP